MAVTGMFQDEGNQRTVLLWVALPLVLTFGCWMAVQSGRVFLRALVWLSIVLIAFFIWIAVFSIGPYYLPVLVLLLFAGFAPWPSAGPTNEVTQGKLAGEDEDQEPGPATTSERLGNVLNPAPEE